MKNLYIYAIAIVLFFAACGNEDETIPTPTDVTNVQVEPRVGGAKISWEQPAEGSYTYLEVRYLVANGVQKVVKVSKYTDSLLVQGLINKEEYAFEIQSFNDFDTRVSSGTILTTEKVRPIKRGKEITYFPNDLTPIELTEGDIDTFTQEASEGPKANLIDGDPGTFWHSAWSSGVAPLPHWIQVNKEVEVGAIKYYFRQNNGDKNGRPKKWALATSADGTSWETVWESDEVSVEDNSVEHTLVFDKNYSAKFFRMMIMENGSGTYAHLGEIAFFTMGASVVDKEAEAEAKYYEE